MLPKYCRIFESFRQKFLQDMEPAPKKNIAKKIGFAARVLFSQFATVLEPKFSVIKENNYCKDNNEGAEIDSDIYDKVAGLYQLNNLIKNNNDLNGADLPTRILALQKYITLFDGWL